MIVFPEPTMEKEQSPTKHEVQPLVAESHAAEPLKDLKEKDLSPRKFSPLIRQVWRYARFLQ